MSYILIPFLSGFALSASLIMAIGAQNLFVLRQGLKKEHIGAIVLFCGLSDALLITLGVSGVGAFLSKIPQLSKIFTLAGFLFLSYYSIMALRRAMKPEDSLNLSKGHSVSLAKALFTVAAFTWLNPHVYIDTVLLMGTAASAQPYSLRPIFGIGASAASFVWFFALGYAARFLQPIFQHPRSWQRLDILTGSVMLFLAFLLLWQGILHPFLSL
ncbi:lysine exporter protein (LYSE/YGGA) [Zymomonas mobilis subsp. mobilis ZM4 = ATCC 31821]|uniref:Lysine exporter protein (LYSE/YGGA) n=1 Tax=Zymomonas mobilis subsp. mobilis (strain ATCC 31821 / ZM4 / CP4) TaxID=264203 RepID=Q5NL13_ZYMMO|nr:LysE/ArgO family amino acid transporter [Zymomonas mobilis]AAV90597.1 Lysine exporter protein (LYSE/YGGA) [Zymomonas mobilis subsp. mobilis ZM4 = ATCC 31821]AVZ26772.1 lysine exporter protein (LYSE/YGGA) [Zymomonas mobilis subsp. mobilis]AVZ28658.1 lysine exporter protein (LYSE/YGGA) [Zymomonas mobilis subsp. mobilis]AVZ43104.1 lysine exporter protein (LYSE/YGGA) [Zymomonas mobilis subsp. mobilis ZM4 = ATCC 31821]UBQ07851.1 LysE/ArgO family amino acid transporter [Zymomonas mobilis]